MIKSGKLKDCHLCTGLDEEEIEKISTIAIFKKLPKGGMLFFEGDPAIGFYILLSGRIRLYKASPDGKEYTLHLINPGQLFAEAAMFEGDKFPANCIAMEESEVAFFPKRNFLDLLKKSPQISLKIIAGMAGFVREFNHRLEELSLKEVPARLAAYLLELHYKTDQVKLNLDISKTELAAYLGTISETLSRSFKKFKELKAVDVNRQKIILKNIPLLEKIADGHKI